MSFELVDDDEDEARATAQADVVSGIGIEMVVRGALTVLLAANDESYSQISKHEVSMN